MKTRAVDLLVRRIRELDDPSGIHPCAGLEPGVARWLSVVPHVDWDDADDRPAADDVDELDSLVGECAILNRLHDRFPEVIDGPLNREQVWVGAGAPAWLPEPSLELDESRFTGVPRSAELRSTKPFGVGLFTCSVMGETPGMWWAYLVHVQSSLFPRPWSFWQTTVPPNARVFEVNSAARWCELVTTYPLVDQGAVYPDWLRIAQDFDAVHYTLRAVTATEGFWFRSRLGDLAPPRWHVESTLWLNWCFDSVEPWGPINSW